MLQFFKGWRRKAGCVTLVMACLMTVMWMRGRIGSDQIVYLNGIVRHHWESGPRGLSWIKYTDISSDPLVYKPIWTYRLGFRLWSDPTVPGFLGFEATDELHDNKAGEYRRVEWIVPHWFAVGTMTLLSAYLILWKPRKREAKRISEDNSN